MTGNHPRRMVLDKRMWRPRHIPANTERRPCKDFNKHSMGRHLLVLKSCFSELLFFPLRTVPPFSLIPASTLCRKSAFLSTSSPVLLRSTDLDDFSKSLHQSFGASWEDSLKAYRTPKCVDRHPTKVTMETRCMEQGRVGRPGKATHRQLQLFCCCSVIDIAEIQPYKVIA